MGQLLIVVDQVVDVHVAVESLEEGVFPQLISGAVLLTVKGIPYAPRDIPVYESVVEPEVEDEGLELLLDLDRRILVLVEVGVLDVSRIH